MSIIQEALKKSKVNGAGIKIEKPDMRSVKSPNIFFIVLFLAAAAFAVKWLAVPAPADKTIAEKPKSAEVRVTRSDELVTGLKELATPMRHVKSAFEGKTQVPSNLALNGIMYLVERPQAIINDSVVEVGDIVDGAKVTRINNSSVLLNYNDAEITLTLAQ